MDAVETTIELCERFGLSDVAGDAIRMALEAAEGKGLEWAARYIEAANPVLDLTLEIVTEIGAPQRFV